jgi:hypothetical protein
MSTPPPDAAPCPEIGKGWFLQTVPRKHGKHIDRYWYSPCGRRFRSRPEVDRFIQSTESKEKIALKHALGKVIYKKFPSYGSELVEFKGTIENYEPDRNLYKIVYEDGDEEEMSEEDIDMLLSRMKNEVRNEKRKAARARAKANSLSSGSNKRKSTDGVGDENPYKKQYKSNKSSSAGAKEMNVSKLIKSPGKSKSKKSEDNLNELMPPVVNIPPQEMRAAILENRLPQALIPAATTVSSNQRKITLKAAALRRVEAAKRWVASAALNVESAKKQLEAARKARLEALTEQAEATNFLEQVLDSIPDGGFSFKRSTGESKSASLLQSKHKNSNAGSVVPTKEADTETKNPEPNSSTAKPADETTAGTHEPANDDKTNGEHEASDESKDHCDVSGKNDAESFVEEKESLAAQRKNDDKANDAYDEVSDEPKDPCEAKGKSNGNGSSVDNALVNSTKSKKEKETSVVQKLQTNNLPLKKGPSSIGSAARDNSSEAADDIDESIIYVKTTAHPPADRNRRFSDLAPEAQEVLRKTVLAALSSNGKINPALMKCATDRGIPPRAVEDAVKVAVNKLRSVASNAAKSKTPNGRVLYGIELSGFGLSEFDGVYEKCREESEPASNHPPTFQKKLTYNGKTAIFRLGYCGDDYQKDTSKWEVSLLLDEAEKKETGGNIAADIPRYSGSITRQKASDNNSSESFTRTWISSSGKECELTVTPLYSQVI